MLNPLTNLAPFGRRPFVGGFSPLNISGLRLWLKADSLALNDNDPVTTWSDQSGLGNDASQATPTEKPTYKANIVNGKPVVRFDGSSDRMTFAGVATPRHIFAALKSNTGHAASPPAFIGQTAGSAYLLRFFSSTSYWNAPNGNDFYNGAGGEVRVNGAVSYENGGVFHVMSSTRGASATVSGDQLTFLGEHIGRWFNGDLGEIIVYNSVLSAADRGLVESYLAGRWL